MLDDTLGIVSAEVLEVHRVHLLEGRRRLLYINA